MSLPDVSVSSDWRAVFAALLPEPQAGLVESLQARPNGMTVVLATSRSAAPCPNCSICSTRVHSRYHRTLADLPWSGVAILLDLHTRRFSCDQPACPRPTFSAPLPQLAARYGRRTLRCEQVLRAVAFALGGEAGSRLAARLSIPVSADSLLSRLRQSLRETTPKLRAVGVVIGPGKSTRATAPFSWTWSAAPSWICCRTAKPRP